MTNLYDGIFISSHCIIDQKTKIAAQGKLYNWVTAQLPAEEWIRKLDAGQTIQPSKFRPRDDESFTHKRDYWESTHFICADGDHINSVEFYEEDVTDTDGNILHKVGDDKNPDGIDPWTEPGKLSQIYPELLNDVYAVGESVSSMLSEPLHRRFRIIFLFDKPITSESHFRHILSKLQEKYLIIDRASRSPAQPVFGNGRDDFSFHICGNILNLDDYPEPAEPKQTYTNGNSAMATNETLEEYLRRQSINHTPTNEPNKFYVECPFRSAHTGGKQGPTDSYVFDDGTNTGWGYYCSHAHCAGKRTWQAFKDGMGLSNGHIPKKPLKCEPPPEPPEIEQSDEDPMKVKFPEELFYGVFEAYRDSLENRTPVPDAFAFATLKHIISACLGRRIHIESQIPIYPNLYTGLIGESSSGHKGISLTVAEDLLEQSDPNVLILNRTATEEGLVDLFKTPELREGTNSEGEEYSFFTGGFADLYPRERVQSMVDNIDSHESVRIMGSFEELSAVLNRSKKVTYSGMVELLLKLYDMRKDVMTPNKGEKDRAQFPTFTMIGASAFELIEQSLAQHFITAGFTNRVEWYLGEEKDPILLYKRADPNLWTECVNVIKKVRDDYAIGQSFELTDEAYELADRWNREFTEKHRAIDNILIAGSMKRMKIFNLKNGLIFAALEHRGDLKIHAEDILKAIQLSQYNCTVVENLFGSFASTEHQRVCNRIKAMLLKTPNLSAKQIQNQMKWADVKEIDMALDLMAKLGMINTSMPKRTLLYYIAKNSEN